MKNESTEAPRVAFTSIKTPAGFNWSYTIRGDNGTDMITAIEKFEEVCKSKGWTPNEAKSYSKTAYPKKELNYVKDEKGEKILCPICKVAYQITDINKKTGKEFRKCETQKWNFTLKQVEGCKFVDWTNGAGQTQTKQEDINIEDIPF